MKTSEELYNIYLKKAKINGRKEDEIRSFTDDPTGLVGLIKNEIQKYALDMWWKKGARGTLSIATGVGKTRIGVLVAGTFIRMDQTERSLISVWTESLRDGEWPDEIEKWGFSDVRDKITIECHATSKRRRYEEWGTLVVDEAHAFLTKGGEEFLKLNTFKRVVFLSASISDKKKIAILQKTGIPICFSYGIEKAEDDGVVSENTRIVLKVSLTPEEEAEYKAMTDKLNTISLDMHKDPRKKYTAEQLAELAISSKGSLGLAQAILAGTAILPGRDSRTSRILAANYLKLVGRRKEIIYYSENKSRALKEIFEEVIPSGDQSIVFAETTDYVDAVVEMLQDYSSIGYHSKLKAKEKRDNLTQFREKKSKTMVAAKALNAGLNVPSVKWGISISGNSSELDKTQREGRIFRVEEGKHAVFINIICRDTMDEDWNNNSYKRRRKKPIVVKSIEALKACISTKI